MHDAAFDDSPSKNKLLRKKKLKENCRAVDLLLILAQFFGFLSIKTKRNKINVLKGSKIIIKRLISDGVLVSTPAGSTAYNLSVHGPILSLDSKKISISPISAFRPRRWKGKVLGDRSKIVIRNLNPKKRPISAVADNFEVRNVKYISIKTPSQSM